MAAYTYKQLLGVAEKIAAGFGLSDDMSKKTTGFICQNHNNLLADILAGDLSSVPAVLDEMKLTDGSGAQGVNTSKNSGSKNKNFSPSQKDRQKIGVASSADKPKGKQKTTAGKTSRNAGGAVDMITGAAVVCEEVNQVATTDGGGLPDSLPETIEETIKDFCSRYEIESLHKARQTQWASACKYIGQSIFKNNRGLLADRDAVRGRGGFAYDFGKLSALCDLWVYLCGIYGKAPIIDDFAHFAGVDDNFIYGSGGRYTDADKATPGRVRLLQKLHAAQEAGLAGLIVDGRQNPTGALAALNHWHGWTQTREVIHTSAAAASSAGSLPDFGNNSGLLTDSGGGSGGSGE